MKYLKLFKEGEFTEEISKEIFELIEDCFLEFIDSGNKLSKFQKIHKHSFLYDNYLGFFYLEIRDNNRIPDYYDDGSEKDIKFNDDIFIDKEIALMKKISSCIKRLKSMANNIEVSYKYYKKCDDINDDSYDVNGHDSHDIHFHIKNEVDDED